MGKFFAKGYNFDDDCIRCDICLLPKYRIGVFFLQSKESTLYLCKKCIASVYNMIQDDENLENDKTKID
jgi:hypothetical protein